jgi:hypothetical protein
LVGTLLLITISQGDENALSFLLICQYTSIAQKNLTSKKMMKNYLSYSNILIVLKDQTLNSTSDPHEFTNNLRVGPDLLFIVVVSLSLSLSLSLFLFLHLQSHLHNLKITHNHLPGKTQQNPSYSDGSGKSLLIIH